MAAVDEYPKVCTFMTALCLEEDERADRSFDKCIEIELLLYCAVLLSQYTLRIVPGAYFTGLSLIGVFLIRFLAPVIVYFIYIVVILLATGELFESRSYQKLLRNAKFIEGERDGERGRGTGELASW